LAGLAYYLLSRALIAAHDQNSVLAKAIGRDTKGILSLVFYTIAIALAFFLPLAAFAVYVLVAIIWLIPDRRIEKNVPAH
jgi:uncharacterized membrane protein